MVSNTGTECFTLTCGSSDPTYALLTGCDQTLCPNESVSVGSRFTCSTASDMTVDWTITASNQCGQTSVDGQLAVDVQGAP